MDRDSHALMRVKLEDAIREFELHGYRFPINADSGFHTDFAQLPNRCPWPRMRDYENYIAACAPSRATWTQNIELMREGLEARLDPAARRRSTATRGR